MDGLNAENEALEFKLVAAKKIGPKETTASWVATLVVLTLLYLATWALIVVSTLAVSHAPSGVIVGTVHLVVGLTLVVLSGRA